MSRHKYSTYTLVFIGILLLIAGASAIFTSGDMDEICDGENSYLMRNGTSWGCYNETLEFSNGWASGGVTIDGGDIYAQTGYFYNITSLNVTQQNLTINDILYVQNAVGIGLDNPSEVLEMTGTNPKFQILDDLGNQNIRMGDTGSVNSAFLTLYEGGTPKVHITTDPVQSGSNTYFLDSNVGIGTASPDSQLHLHGATGFRLTDSNQNANEYAEIKYDNAGVTNLYINSDYTNTNGLINFQHAGSTKMVVRGDGNVGIGTTSPASELEVSDTSAAVQLTMTAAANNDQSIVFREATTNKWLIGRWSSAATDGFRIYDYGLGDTVMFFEDTTGDVGIGTASPSQRLEIADAGASTNLQIGRIRAVDGFTILDTNSDTTFATNGNIMNIIDRNNDGTENYWRIRNNGDTGTDLFHVGDDGNVGIGETSPDEMLHLTSGLDTQPEIKLENTNGNVNSPNFKFLKNTASPNDDDVLGTIRFNGNNVAPTEIEYGTIFMRSSDVTTSTEDSIMEFRTRTAGSLGTDMSIKSGQVGIGTTNPSGLFHIEGENTQVYYNESDATTNNKLWKLGAQGEQFVGRVMTDADAGGVLWLQVDRTANAVDSISFPNGNVGIGTTSPDSLLDISQNTDGATTTLTIQETAASGSTDEAAQILFKHEAAEHGGYILSGRESNYAGTANENSFLSFATANGAAQNNVEAMRIDSDGNVGIGITSPSEKLDIKSSNQVDDLIKLQDNTGATRLSIGVTNGTAGGYGFIHSTTGGETDPLMTFESSNIGIGTTNPQQKLNVAGSFNQSGSGIGIFNAVYGELYGHDAGEQNILAQNVYYNLTNLTNGLSNGVTLGGSNMTIVTAGVYKITTQWSFSGSASQEYHLSLYQNGVIQGNKCHTERVIGTGGDVGSAGFTCLLTLTAGDILKPTIENIDSSGNATIEDFNMNIWRIGN